MKRIGARIERIIEVDTSITLQRIKQILLDEFELSVGVTTIFKYLVNLKKR
jgi:hypothetical protein